jgi:putative nucleotidyltransferase with HDIG domain
MGKYRPAKTRGTGIAPARGRTDHLKAETAIIWLYRPETAQLEPACGRGWLAELAQPIDYGRCVAGFVFISGETRISENLVEDPLAEDGAAKSFLPGWRGIWIPIRTADQVVGVMLIAFPSMRQITADEVHLLTTIAEMAGNAIHRASLYEQTERSLQRLNALRTIDIAITSSTELSLSLSVLLTQARLLLDADAVVILKVNPLLQTLEFLAGKGFPSPAIENTRLRLGQGYAGIVALERRPVSIPNTTTGLKDGNRMDIIRTQAFQAYHAVPLVARGHLKGVLEVFHKRPFQPQKDWLETLDALAGQAAIAIENAELFDELEKSNLQLRLAYDATIEGWSRALDMRDRETEGHTQRVAEMTVELARLMGFTEDELIHIRRGALLHDIGKMAIPDSILNKPAPLTESEWKIMRQHPVLARSMLASIEYLRPAMDIPYYHHERWNGSGYPEGLKEEAIPLAARIFAVVDVWDALRAPRPYREAWPAREIEHFLETESRRLFDPQVVKVFLQKVAR